MFLFFSISSFSIQFKISRFDFISLRRILGIYFGWNVFRIWCFTCVLTFWNSSRCRHEAKIEAISLELDNSRVNEQRKQFNRQFWIKNARVTCAYTRQNGMDRRWSGLVRSKHRSSVARRNTGGASSRPSHHRSSIDQWKSEYTSFLSVFSFVFSAKTEKSESIRNAWHFNMTILWNVAGMDASQRTSFSFLSSSKHDRSEIQFDLRRIRASSAVSSSSFPKCVGIVPFAESFFFFFFFHRTTVSSARTLKSDVNELICSFVFMINWCTRRNQMDWLLVVRRFDPPCLHLFIFICYDLDRVFAITMHSLRFSGGSQHSCFHRHRHQARPSPFGLWCSIIIWFWCNNKEYAEHTGIRLHNHR